ncbi:MAG: DUF6577 family protein [Marinilabiliaceae bacterium]
MNVGKSQIVEFANANRLVNADLLSTTYGMKPATARQYLSSLAKANVLARIGQGVYSIAQKQPFTYLPSDLARAVYERLTAELPFTDFCIYDGSIFSSVQHHLSVNRAIYVETNRDAVETVFTRLKSQYEKVYRQPSSSFMYDYVDLRNECVIVKTLVTESPTMKAGRMKVPTLEKLLVDTQKDADFDYLRGSESYNMFRQAFDLYAINTTKMMRYAKRRGIDKIICGMTNQAK